MSKATKHTLANLGYGTIFWVAFAVFVLAALSIIGGCGVPRRAVGASASSLAGATIDAKQAEARLRGSTNQIEEANTEIAAAVPEVAKQTGEIAAAVEELRQVHATVLSLIDKLAKEEKSSAKINTELANANREIARLEDKANGTLNTLLIGASVAGLGLAVVCGVWLRSWQGVLTGLAIVAVCAAGMWILQYRAWIAIGGAIIAAGYAAWCIIAERKVATDVVRTVEAIKPFVPDFKDKANAEQTKLWVRKHVDKIKATFQKKAKA
jgi:hypothetical protein